MAPKRPDKPSKPGQEPETKTKAKTKTRAGNGPKRPGGSARGASRVKATPPPEPGEETYSQRVRSYMASNALFGTREVVAACQMELDMLGLARELQGSRHRWLKLKLDALKLMLAESQVSTETDDGAITFNLVL